VDVTKRNSLPLTSSKSLPRRQHSKPRRCVRHGALTCARSHA